MLDLNDFYYFVHVVDRRGFTAASRSLRIPKSTISHRIQELEKSLGVRLLNRTSRRFGVSDVGREFYRHAVAMLEHAELAESATRDRLTEPKGTVRFTASVATAQFAMNEVVAEFLARYPLVNLIGSATDDFVDIVGENYDVAVRAHTGPLRDSTLVARTLAPAPWYLFAGARYLDTQGAPQTPKDLAKHPSLFMMRANVAPEWRLRRARGASKEVVLQLTPRLITSDMVGLKHAAIAGLGIVALPGYVCRVDVRRGALRRVLPDWIAGDSTLTALVPHRLGLLPAVRAFVDCLAAELPKMVAL
ncbi:Transcriptional regulator, LysR family [Labilithrix luteola]|uniref:Transcriptional regulator, LysR family n=1 Tax=Labilithrix luteola TaxID=1391654 RepID=A0A0K1Q6L0_9BACT|nr:LysR substrate-binding domain-containing protein [Labilithrix luteola]AKV01373.1 Transcriptional regulator, LysR family [Labilithrix luteola]